MTINVKQEKNTGSAKEYTENNRLSITNPIIEGKISDAPEV